MERLVLVVLGLCLIGCDHSGKYPIEGANGEADYYIQQLNTVNNKLKEGDKETELLYKKLYASQYLNWPEDVEKEIWLLVERDGLNFELYNYAADFFVTYRKYEALNQLVDSWLEKRSAAAEDFRWKIIALNGLQRSVEADNFLWSLLQESDKPEDQLFVGQTYLQLKDTARAIYAYAQVASKQSSHPALLDEYVPLLIAKGYPQRARDLLSSQSIAVKDYEKAVSLAKALYSLGDWSKAIELLKRYDNKESLFQLATWYHDANNWDSAIYFTNRLIMIDSGRRALFKKAVILEDRGWLYSALENFEAIIARNPQDSIAISRTQIVERKIAYLRRLREAEDTMPVLDISSKKSTENE